MGRHSLTTPPFLQKLLLLTQTTPNNISKWSSNGNVYIVLDEMKFNTILKKFFKGNYQTFTRQLHFYGFKKIDINNINKQASDMTKDEDGESAKNCDDVDHDGCLEEMQKEEGKWGFKHELFKRDQPELIEKIKRKTKIDPEAMKLASVHEVEALKSQMYFLQDTIQSLKDQIDVVGNVLEQNKLNGKAEIVINKSIKVKQEDENVVPSGNGVEKGLFKQGSFTLQPKHKKRPRSDLEKLDSFEKVCASITPPKNSLKNDIMSMSFDSVDFDKFVESPLNDFFSDIEISDADDLLEEKKSVFAHFGETNRPDTSQKVPAILNDKKSATGNLFNNAEAVKLISEATKVKEGDVDKILEYLSKLSIGGVTNTNVMEKRNLGTLAGCEKLTEIIPLRIQRVGAN